MWLTHNLLEALPPAELPFLEDDRKLPVVIQKPDVDKSVGGNSTELDKDVALETENSNVSKILEKSSNEQETPRRKNESRLKLNKKNVKNRNVTLRSDKPKRSLRNREFDI